MCSPLGNSQRPVKALWVAESEWLASLVAVAVVVCWDFFAAAAVVVHFD